MVPLRLFGGHFIFSWSFASGVAIFDIWYTVFLVQMTLSHPPIHPCRENGVSLGSHWGCLEVTWFLVSLLHLEQPSLIFGILCFRYKWPWVIPPSIPEVKMGCSLRCHWGWGHLIFSWSFAYGAGIFDIWHTVFRYKWPLVIPPSIPEEKMGCSLRSHWGCLEVTWSLVG